MDNRPCPTWYPLDDPKSKSGFCIEKNSDSLFNALFCTHAERYGSVTRKIIADDSRYAMYVYADTLSVSIQKPHGKIAKTGLSR
jgi:hypothetical protein